MSSISDFQPFPQTGRLAQNLNLSLDDLCLKIGELSQLATVYSYIVATVKNPEGHFIQTGSAPNFQGDVISLCTCKHYMRTFRTIDEWCDNIWIAGFTGTGAGKGKNVLIYLTKVGSAFECYYDLWFSDKLSEAAKKFKLAHKNKFGDVFQPQIELRDKFFDHRNKFGDDFQFQPQNYFPPVHNHVHANPNDWHKDINYLKGASGRKAALLMGDTQYSFLWNEPRLFYSHKLPRGQKKDNLQYLLTSLSEIRMNYESRNGQNWN